MGGWWGGWNIQSYDWETGYWETGYDYNWGDGDDYLPFCYEEDLLDCSGNWCAYNAISECYNDPTLRIQYIDCVATECDIIGLPGNETEC